MKAQKKVTIDLNSPRRNVVHVGQGDNQRQILLTLLKDGAPFDVSEGIGSATLVMGVKYVKANGVGGYYDWTSTDEAAVALIPNTINQYSVLIDEHATDVPGFAEIFVTFSLTSGETLHSFPVILDVGKTRGGSTDPDKPYYHSSSFLLAGAQEAKTAAMTQPIGVAPDGSLWTTPGAGLSNEAKELLLECLSHCAWATSEGQTYLSALETALFPPASLVSISAVFTQGDNVVTPSDSLDSLKPMLTVTALYDDQTTDTITNYTLSGTLAEGTSTITVSYGGKTTTFTVEVSSNVLYTITADQLLRKTGIKTSSPYVDSNATNRMTYGAFDLTVEGGQRLKFTATSTKPAANMAALFYNQTAVTAVGRNQTIANSDFSSSPWQALSFEWDVPETINGSPVACVRLTFRQDSTDPVLTDDFIISQIVIERVPAGGGD